MIVSIVGTDGCGKSSSVKYLEKTLIGEGFSVSLLDKWDIYDFEKHPECRFLQAPLPLLRQCISEMPSAGRAMFIFWSIYISISKAKFDPNRIYLLDGYWMKHFATETIFGIDADWILTVASQLPKPDLTVLLHASPAEAYRRKALVNDFVPYEFGLDPEMKKENFLNHQTKVQQVLLEWAALHGWTVLDADRPADVVRADILQVLQRHAGFSLAQLA